MLDTVTQLWYFTLNSHIAPKIQQYNKERNVNDLNEVMNYFGSVSHLQEKSVKWMRISVALVMMACASYAMANPPILVDRHTGKYLGNLSNNQYDQNSTSNPYGRYGSEYSQDSINNPYGQYGSQYSNDSPNNPYATNPPAVVAPCYYGC